jgi:hypothetical protein
MKQTAVEWLYERLERMIPRTTLYDIDKREYFEQAKAMEKQQIMNAVDYGTSDWGSYKDPEVYYNETYNNKTK